MLFQPIFRSKKTYCKISIIVPIFLQKQEIRVFLPSDLKCFAVFKQTRSNFHFVMLSFFLQVGTIQNIYASLLPNFSKFFVHLRWSDTSVVPKTATTSRCSKMDSFSANFFRILQIQEQRASINCSSINSEHKDTKYTEICDIVQPESLKPNHTHKANVLERENALFTFLAT